MREKKQWIDLASLIRSQTDILKHGAYLKTKKRDKKIGLLLEGGGGGGGGSSSKRRKGDEVHFARPLPAWGIPLHSLSLEVVDPSRASMPSTPIEYCTPWVPVCLTLIIELEPYPLPRPKLSPQQTFARAISFSSTNLCSNLSLEANV